MKLKKRYTPVFTFDEVAMLYQIVDLFAELYDLEKEGKAVAEDYKPHSMSEFYTWLHEIEEFMEHYQEE